MNLRRCYCCGTEFDAGETTDEIKLAYCHPCRGMDKADANFYGLLGDPAAVEYRDEDGPEDEDDEDEEDEDSYDDRVDQEVEEREEEDGKGV